MLRVQFNVTVTRANMVATNSKDVIRRDVNISQVLMSVFWRTTFCQICHGPVSGRVTFPLREVTSKYSFSKVYP